METKASFRSMKICRFCLVQDETVSSIYDKKIFSSSRNSLSLSVQIMACLSVEVFPSDGLPCNICERCRFFIDSFYHFKQMCRQADEQILAHIEDGIVHLISPLVWPKKLTRLYSALQGAKKKINKVKTVKTESGATVQVQVTAADLQSDSDAEEEENTFKISIDGNYNEDPDCIKVVKASSNQVLKLAANEQSFFNPIIAQGDDRKYNCTICNKVFGSHNYYRRHMQMRHKSLSVTHGPRGPYGEYELYRCDQCEEVFQSQDGLIYHSAKHATENLTCPLCQEKFQHVEEVSDHIKTHVDGAEFMCDLCELVFTTKEKLDQHLIDKHSEELRQEQELGLEDESMEEEEEDDHIRIKEENGQMVVEVQKNFVASTPGADVTNSEESDSEITLPVPKQQAALKVAPPSPVKVDGNKPVSILKKAEEMKRKSLQKPAAAPGRTPTPQKQAKPAASATVASPSPAATADKSLRLLEKELQELQRTNTNRAENSKPAAKNPEPQRPKRSHVSTPKTRPQEEKKLTNATKTPASEKKPERRAAAAAAAAVTKENKEPKETKETKSAPSKEDKVSEPETEKEEKPKEASNAKVGKTAKNNANDDSVRRSSRSGKTKDWAKIVHDRSSDESTDDDEEYTQAPTRTRKSTAAASKGTPQPTRPDDEESPAAVTGNAKKRGRPRKPATKTDATPAKVAKTAEDDSKASEEEDSEPIKSAQKESTTAKVIKKPPEAPAKEDTVEEPPESPAKEGLSPEDKAEIIKSPSGQTLKKVPIKALPPGVKPLPLHGQSRPAQSGQLCEMQIGKKMVKVQKIVMTKAEVEAMAKKGLVEVKHGTMVLKQGIKLPTSDPASIKTTLMTEASKDGDEKPSNNQ